MQQTLRILGLTVLTLVFARQVPEARAFELEIVGDRITVEASQVPLQRLLKAVSRHGIIVRADPGIDPAVTLSFQNRDLEDGLKALLRPNNHVLIWQAASPSASVGALPGPSHRLSEIHVFRPGLKSRMVELNPAHAQESPASDDTRVLIRGNKVFVPVVIGYQGQEVETSLIFDTGAGSVVLHQKVAVELGIEATQPSRGRGVGGIPIETQTARLDYVRVGPHTKKNLRTDIIGFQGTPDENYNGLLGMNFLRGLKYTIDFDRQVIQWHP